MRKLRRNSFFTSAIYCFLAVPIAAIASQAPPMHFTKPMPYDAGGTPSSVAVADVNRDGRLDLVVVYFSEGNVGVLLGKGDGTFQAAVKYPSGGNFASSVAVADVNADSKPDIVVLNAFNDPGTVGVLLGNGDGSFQAPTTYDTGQYSIPEALAVGDLNGDGHPDIAVANFGHSDCDCNDGRVGVLWANGDGTFQPMVFYRSGGYDTVSISIVEGAWVVTNLCQDHYCDWPNGSVCWRACYDTGGIDPFSAAVGDLNGDGHFDIVVGNYTSRNVSVMLNDGYGGFGDPVLYDAGGHPWGVAAGDVNGDGKPDIVVDVPSASNVLLGNGDGTFQTSVSFGSVGRPTLADVNGDGKLDLIGSGGIMLNTSGFTTATQLTSSLNPSFVNQSVTFTAMVTSKHGPIPDAELVIFYDNGTALTSVALVNGTATYTTSSLTARTHAIKAAYLGDASLAPSKGTVKQQVLRYATITTLTAAPNPSTYGQAVTFTAKVRSAGPAPTGKLRFVDDGLLLGSATLNGGSATLTYSKLLVGIHGITAQYVGDGFSDKSTSSVLNQRVK